MIKVLQDSFWEHMNCPSSCCETEEQMYTKILDKLIECGMLPPRGLLNKLQLEDNCWEEE